jgi:hypothetical protein
MSFGQNISVPPCLRVKKAKEDSKRRVGIEKTGSFPVRLRGENA